MEPSLIPQSQNQLLFPLTHFLSPSPNWELPEVREQVEPPQCS